MSPRTYWQPQVTFHMVLVLGQERRLLGDQAAAIGSVKSRLDLLTVGFRELQLGETKGTPMARSSRALPQPDSPSLFPIPVLQFIRFPLTGSQISLQQRCLQPQRRLSSLAPR